MDNSVIRSILVAITLLFVCFQVYAQSEPCEKFYANQIKPRNFDGAWAFSAIYNEARNVNGCILNKGDTTGIAKLFNTLFSGKNQPELQIRDKQIKIINLVLTDMESDINGECSQQNQPACLLKHEISKVEELRTDLESTLVDAKNPLLQQNNWVVKSDGRQLITGDNLSTFLQGQCPALASDKCKTAVLVVAKIIRSGEAMAQLSTHYKLPIIGQNKKFLSSRDKEWDTYFNGISVQYPWELGINSYIYTRNKTDEQLSKLPAPPNSKLIIMHPSIGYERINTPEKEGSLVGTVLVELIGYERWDWNLGEAKNRWGGSLVVSFADIKGMDSAGYGFMIHTPIKNTSIGIIRRDGVYGEETGVFVNFDISRLLVQYKDRDLIKFLSR